MSMPRSQVSRILTAVAFLGATAFGVGRIALAVKVKPPLEHLLPPENVAATTRSELRGRMTRHANTMSTLVRAVVLLDRPTMSTMAQRIADEELLARAEPNGLEMWRPLLPKGFFVEQETLRTTARALAEAAARGEPDATLAQHFGALTATCVRCHGSYLHDPPSATVR
jgi:hypothetical protein